MSVILLIFWGIVNFIKGIFKYLYNALVGNRTRAEQLGLILAIGLLAGFLLFSGWCGRTDPTKNIGNATEHLGNADNAASNSKILQDIIDEQMNAVNKSQEEVNKIRENINQSKVNVNKIRNSNRNVTGSELDNKAKEYE